MGKFSTVSRRPATVENFAGGRAFKESDPLALVSLLVTSFVKDQFYRTEAETLTELKNLIAVNEKLFVAKAILLARKHFGMRSITHVAASELSKHISGKAWARNFYDQVIHRVDDLTEITAYHTEFNGKLSSAMKAGFARAIARFEPYNLAKYKGESNKVKLVDVVNMVHPKPSEANGDGLKQLVDGELKSFDTWEVDLSKAGADKAKVWASLIETKKLGYFALLKNLRNIIQQAPDAINDAMDMLINEKLIKKSLVLPFRFMKAYEEIEKLQSDKITRTVLGFISKAIEISLSNVPKFEGDTLVVLDTSQSMTTLQTGMTVTAAKIGALFAAVLAKSNNADMMTFDSDARYVKLNHTDSVASITKSIEFDGRATNFRAIFEAMKDYKYDRVIILSDMQGWSAGGSRFWGGNPYGDNANLPSEVLKEYKTRSGSNPSIYSFDLQGYGTLQFPQASVYALAGFSDKTFDLLKCLDEGNKNAFVDEVNKIELS